MLRVGIIGSGFGVIGLMPAFDSVENCKVVAICAKKSRELISYCDRTGFKNIYTNWQLLLENEGLDAIAIAVTPSVQYQIAKIAITKGLHVFAEKPLAANISQARELFALAKKNKIIHGIDFIFPEISEWKKVKELISTETFGKLEHISVSWDWLSGDIKNKRSSWKTSVAEGGGALAFYFSHGLYYLEHFAGEIENVKSLFTNTKESINGDEVGVDILLKFQRGITGHAHASCNSKGLTKHQIIFQCEDGVIVLENQNAVVDKFIIKTYSQSGIKQLRVRKDRGHKNDDERVKIVRKIATRFVNSCISKKQMFPSFIEGLRVQELIEMVRKEKVF